MLSNSLEQEGSSQGSWLYSVSYVYINSHNNPLKWILCYAHSICEKLGIEELNMSHKLVFLVKFGSLAHAFKHHNILLLKEVLKISKAHLYILKRS